MRKIVIFALISAISGFISAKQPADFDDVKSDIDSLKVKIENLSAYKKSELVDSISQCVYMLDEISRDADYIVLSLEKEIEAMDLTIAEYKSMISYISRQDSGIFYETNPFEDFAPIVLEPYFTQIKDIINFKNCVDSVEMIIVDAKENPYIDLTQSEDKIKVREKNIVAFERIYELYDKIMAAGGGLFSKEQWDFFIKHRDRFNALNDMLK